MATIREYFDSDSSKHLTAHKDWELRDQSGSRLSSLVAKILYDLDGNAKYWSFFIPEDAPSDCMMAIFRNTETSQCILSKEDDGLLVEMGFADYSEKSSSATLIFTKRIFLYIDTLLTLKSRKDITQLGLQHGYFVVVRDQEYAMKRSQYEKPLAFISHDSRDKESMVRPLVFELSKLMCPVWYDEYSLKVGDSLRASIEKGLKESKKCVVILSPSFFSNEGWGRAEFDSIYTREIIEKSNVMLPVWHHVSKNDVYQYSPRLADKVALNSSMGIEELARKLLVAIK